MYKRSCDCFQCILHSNNCMKETWRRWKNVGVRSHPFEEGAFEKCRSGYGRFSSAEIGDESTSRNYAGSSQCSSKELGRGAHRKNQQASGLKVCTANAFVLLRYFWRQYHVSRVTRCCVKRPGVTFMVSREDITSGKVNDERSVINYKMIKTGLPKYPIIDTGRVEHWTEVA